MIPIKSQMLTFVQKSDVNGGNRNVSIDINSKSGPLLIHEQMMNWIKINRIQLAITVIGLLSFLCFLPSISNEFVFDDIPTIINNKDVCPEKTYFTKIFFNDFWGTPIVKEESHKSYRPLTILTFRWNFMLHGLQVTGYHLVNNILHSIVSILFFRLCLCFTHHFWESFIASIYFAIHPIHVDAVASIVGRAELLSALFSLSGLLYYCSYSGNNHDNNGYNNNTNNDKNNNPDKCILIVFLLTFLGTFCKEQASTTLIVCIFHQILFKFNLRTKMINCTRRWIYRFKCYIDSQLTSPKQVSRCKLYSQKMVPGQLRSASTFYKNIFYLSIGFITISCLRFAIMNNKLPSFNRLDNPARILASPYRQLNYAYIWTYNCWLLLNPFNLSCDWSSSSIQLITSLLDPKNVITLATFIFTLLLLLQSDTISWMGLGFMMITFLPASNIFFPLGFVVAERVLYLPSMGFSIIIARGFVLLYSSIKSKRYWIKIAFHLVTFICASSLLVKTVHRCTEWQNELSLFTSGLNVNPTNVKLLNNVGRLYENQGNLSMALSFYEKAVSIQPDDVRGYLNLGKALTKIGRLEEAERSYRKALDLIPRPNEISSKLNSNHYLPVSHHLPYNKNEEKMSEDRQREEQEQQLHLPSSIKASSFDSYGDDKSTKHSIVASTERLTLPGYERLVNQGTNTDTMMSRNEGKHEVKVSPSLASPSALPLASQSASPSSLSDNSGLAAITLNHLQGLLHYASLISQDEGRLDEANRMFSTIASMRPDYSATYSTWIQSMIHGNGQNNNDNGETHKGSPQNDQAQNGQILLSQVTSNNKQTDPDILYNMAILFNNNGNIENALNLFDQALSIDPYHEETLLTSARIIKDNELIGDYLTIAMERLETLVSMGKADETVYFDLGMLAIRSGHMLTARRYFAKAIELKPNFTEALFNMALLLYKDEKPKDALPFLKFLLQTEQDHGKALLLMVAINSSNNDADEQNDLPKSQQLSSPVSSSLSPS